MEKKIKKQKNYFLTFSILIAAILIVGALIYSAGLKNIKIEEQKADALIYKAVEFLKPQIDDDVVLGNPNATTTIFVFSDYQCFFCGKFFKEAGTLIRKNYVETGKIKMVHKDLAFLGPESTATAEANECAKDQGKYWQYHDALFNEEIKDGQVNNGNLNRNLFKKIATDLEMNIDEFLFCFDSRKYESEVQKDIEEAKKVMERISTPTIFINGKIIQGAESYNVFSRAIDEILLRK